MGREIKRVSANFDWPIGIVWKGYLNPYHPIECKACKGRGINTATSKLYDDWYRLGSYERYSGWCYHLEQADVDELIKEGRLRDFTHIWTKGRGWEEKSPPYRPTAQEVNEWAKKGFGHDSINCWICVEAKAKRLGVYGFCELCKGRGHYWCDEKYEALYEAWKSVEPPEGEAYQLWETVSEGAPISPAFSDPKDLAEWLSKQTSGWFEDSSYSAEDWLKFILKNEPAFSMVVENGIPKDGVRAVIDHECK